MRIRSATNADAGRIRELVESVLAEYGLKGCPTDTDTDLDDIEASYVRPGGLFEVVETENEEIIGTVGLYPLRNGTCELRRMYLLPHARGKGLGKRLMDRMIDQARSLGFRCMELETAAVLVEAAALYRRYGFRPIERAALARRCDQVFALDLDADSPASAPL